MAERHVQRDQRSNARAQARQTESLPALDFYERRDEQRRAVVELIGELDAVAAGLTMTKSRHELAIVRDKVEAETFKVLVIGEFKRGKSTLINALLGRKVLPAYAMPATAIVNEVKWGSPPRARLHPRADGNGASEPFDVGVDELEEYVTIDLDDQDAVSPYLKAEIFWDLELCRHSVEVIDSPGLNENEIRDQLTLEYLLTVDATVFVLQATAALSTSETNYLRNGVQQASGATFFVFNRINDVAEDERGQLRRWLTRKVADYADDVDGRVFFVNAKGALDGRVAGDEALLDSSGVPALEAALHDFLANDRGRAKLASPLKLLAGGVRAARAEIPRKRALLATDLGDLEARYERAQGPLKDLELRRHNMLAAMDNHIDELRQDLAGAAEDFYHRTADLAAGWTDGIVVENRIDLKAWKTSEQAEAACKEVGAKLGAKIQDEFTAWTQSPELTALLEARVGRLRAELDRDAQRFTAKVDAIRDELTHDEGDAPPPAPDLPSGTERLIAASIGVLLPGSAVSGATLGMEAMLKSILPQIAVAAAGIFLLGLTPLGLMALLGGSSFLISLGQLDKANEKLKQKVAAAVADELRANAAKRAQEIGASAATPLLKLRDRLGAAAAAEIQTIRDQVEAALADKRAGEQHVAARNRELDETAAALDRLDAGVTDLCHVVDET
ncbi:MAG: dynamin family protein [Solirubrobacteraceae bacterium]